MIKNLIIIALMTLNVSFAWYMSNQNRQTSGEYSQPLTQSPRTTSQSEPVNLQSLTNDPEPYLVPTLDLEYNTLANHLRGSGYDEALVRQILLATINRDHLLSQQASTHTAYWQKSQTQPEDETRLELDWLEEKRLTLREIFGDEIIEDPLFESLFKPLNESMPFLSSDKQIEIFALQNLSEARTDSLFRTGFTQEARAERAAVAGELQDSIQALLTRDEFFEYQLRESRLASNIQQTAENFDFSEQEFRDVFEIRAQNEGSEFSLLTDRSSYRQQREISNDQVEDYLGPERFKEYARSQDPVFRSLQSMGDRYGSSSQEIEQVYDVTNQSREDISLVRDSEGLSRDERRNQINEIRETTYKDIEQIAGKEMSDSVRNNARQLSFGRNRRF